MAENGKYQNAFHSREVPVTVTKDKTSVILEIHSPDALVLLRFKSPESVLDFMNAMAETAFELWPIHPVLRALHTDD